MTTKLPQEKLDGLVARHGELETLMARMDKPEDYVRYSQEYAELDPIVAKVKRYRDAEAAIKEAEDILAETSEAEDPDMRALAMEERNSASEQLEVIAQTLQIALLPKDAADDKGAILEVRAGTGGNEASLFAGDLLRMYERYVAIQGWKMEIISINEGEVGGVKEVISSVTGRGVFARLKFESGVHRVQRVPETESGGRIHTSAATVAVLPEAEDIDIEINESDLRIDVFRASGPGGQSVNTTDSAVRITHLPTGIVVSQQDEKSQHKNRAKGMKILRARIFDAERRKAEEARSAERRGQVGSGDRSERIRTYNFPQGRVSDHRINLTLYKLNEILSGEGLDEIIDALIAEHQATLLANAEI